MLVKLVKVHLGIEEIPDVDIMDEDDTFNTPAAACTREVARRPGNARDCDVDGLLSHASFNLYMPRSHNTKNFA